MLVWGEIEVGLVFLVVIGGVVVTMSSYGCVALVVLVEEQVVELVGCVSECNEMRDLVGD